MNLPKSTSRHRIVCLMNLHRYSTSRLSSCVSGGYVVLEQDLLEQLPHVCQDVQHRVVFLFGPGGAEVLDDEREEVNVLDEVLREV